jgi:hypothetical protein
MSDDKTDPLTMDKVFKSAAEVVGPMKVSEVLAQVDAELKETFGLDLQGLKDAIVASDELIGLLKQTGMDDTAIKSIQDLKIADVLKPFMDLTVNDLMGLMTTKDGEFVGFDNFAYILQNPDAALPEHGTLTLQDFYDNYAKPQMSVTLEQLGMKLPDLSGLYISQAAFTASVTFGSDLALTDLTFAVAGAGRWTKDDDSTSLSMNLKLQLAEISQTGYELALPDGAKTQPLYGNNTETEQIAGTNAAE